MQCPPQPPPPSPLEAARGPWRGGEMLGGSFGGANHRHPKAPQEEANGNLSPGPHYGLSASSWGGKSQAVAQGGLSQGSPESTAMPWHCPAAWHNTPRDLPAAQIQPTANKRACPSRPAEGTPTALLPGKQQANKPSAFLTVLPALGRQHGNCQGDALRNASPFSPTGNREGPTIPSQSPKNYTFGSLNSNQRSPRCSYHRNRQGPRHFWIETSKPPLPFHRIAMTTNTRPLSSR